MEAPKGYLTLDRSVRKRVHITSREETRGAVDLIDRLADLVLGRSDGLHMQLLIHLVVWPVIVLAAYNAGLHAR